MRADEGEIPGDPREIYPGNRREREYYSPRGRQHSPLRHFSTFASARFAFALAARRRHVRCIPPCVKRATFEIRNR